MSSVRTWRALSGAGLERAVRDRAPGLPCQRPAGKLSHSEGYTAERPPPVAEAGMFGFTDFAGVQHEFDFSAGGSLTDKLRHAAPEDCRVL